MPDKNKRVSVFYSYKTDTISMNSAFHTELEVRSKNKTFTLNPLKRVKSETIQ